MTLPVEARGPRRAARAAVVIRGDPGYAFRIAQVAATVHRLSVEDVYKMAEIGVLDEYDRVELVEGVLVDLARSERSTDGATAWLSNHFARVPTSAWQVRVHSMLLIAGGYLLPDLTLVAPLPRSEQPTAAHLVVEIAQTSQARDADKARDYAAADVPEYWIVDLLNRIVTVHRHPLAGAYQEITTVADGASVKPILADAPAVDVSALLG